MFIRYLEDTAVEIIFNDNILVMEGNKSYDNAKVITNSQENKVKSKTARVLSWPGEYEIEDWFFNGIESENESVIFVVLIDHMHVMHPGKSKELNAEILDKLDNIDILILPVDDDYFSVEEATAYVQKVEPKMLIPVGNQASSFLKSLNNDNIQQTTKLKVKKSTLGLNKMEIVDLSS